MAKKTSSIIAHNRKKEVQDIRIYFNNCYDALILAQDRTCLAVSLLLQQNSWIPEEGRQALLSWIGVCQEETNRFKNYVDDSFVGLEKLISSWKTNEKLSGPDQNPSESKMLDYNDRVERSINLDFEKDKIKRFIPVFIYLSNPSIKDIDEILRNMKEVLLKINFTLEHSFKTQWASFFRKLIFKTKNPETMKEVKKDFEKVRKALDLKILGKPQADINKEQAESVSILINSLEGINQAVLLIGTTLIIKNNGKIIAFTLSIDELRYVEKSPDILKKPDKILDILSCYHSLIPYDGPLKSDEDAIQELALIKKA